jgi:hypothetical protein
MSTESGTQEKQPVSSCEHSIDALLTPFRAKFMFLVGAVLYLLIVYNHRSVAEKAKALSAEMESLSSRHDAPIMPKRPFEPQPPRQDAPDLEQRKKEYEENKTKFDGQMKKYEEAAKVHQDRMAKYEEKFYRRNADGEKLGQELKELQLSQNSWAGTRYFLKFISVLLMLFGLMYVVFHGSDWERAAALFVIGVCILNMLSGGL